MEEAYSLISIAWPGPKVHWPPAAFAGQLEAVLCCQSENGPAVSKGQKYNNRRQGQRQRRTNEIVGALGEGLKRITEMVFQHDRDIKVMKARLAAVEREKSRK